MYADIFKFDATNVKTMREFNPTCWCLAKILRKEKGAWNKLSTQWCPIICCKTQLNEICPNKENTFLVSMFWWSCWWGWVEKMAENYSQATNPFSTSDISDHVTYTMYDTSTNVWYITCNICPYLMMKADNFN